MYLPLVKHTRLKQRGLGLIPAITGAIAALLLLSGLAVKVMLIGPVDAQLMALSRITNKANPEVLKAVAVKGAKVGSLVRLEGEVSGPPCHAFFPKSLSVDVRFRTKVDLETRMEARTKSEEDVLQTRETSAETNARHKAESSGRYKKSTTWRDLEEDLSARSSSNERVKLQHYEKKNGEKRKRILGHMQDWTSYSPWARVKSAEGTFTFKTRSRHSLGPWLSKKFDEKTLTKLRTKWGLSKNDLVYSQGKLTLWDDTVRVTVEHRPAPHQATVLGELIAPSKLKLDVAGGGIYDVSYAELTNGLEEAYTDKEPLIEKLDFYGNICRGALGLGFFLGWIAWATRNQ